MVRCRHKGRPFGRSGGSSSRPASMHVDDFEKVANTTSLPRQPAGTIPPPKPPPGAPKQGSSSKASLSTPSTPFLVHYHTDFAALAVVCWQQRERRSEDVDGGCHAESSCYVLQATPPPSGGSQRLLPPPAVPSPGPTASPSNVAELLNSPAAVAVSVSPGNRHKSQRWAAAKRMQASGGMCCGARACIP